MQHIKNHERVAIVHESATLRAAAERMARQGIGCVVVVDDSGLVSGILTDRDLCLRAAAFDRDPDQSTVARAMTHRPCTASVHDSRESYVRTMRKLGVRRLPLVAENGQPVGLVSLDDQVMELSSVLSSLAQVAQPGRRHGPLGVARTGSHDPVSRQNARVDRLFEVRPDQRIDESDGLGEADLWRAIARLR